MDKQIEEMAKDLKECLPNDWYWQKSVDGDTYFVAKHFYNAGYRKIPEGAVVLTREEYDDMFTFKTTRGGFYNILDTIRKVERKKTAEKYHAEIEKAIDSVPNATKEFVEAWKEKNDEIFKEFK